MLFSGIVLEEDGLDQTVSSHQSAVDLVATLADRYQISAIYPLLDICRAAATRLHLTLAGRFKAGKSGFINHLTGRDLLPVGVVPVTSVITELAYAPADTPGLESTFLYSTETSLAWAPNVNIALVAIGVDPPLSQQDIGLTGRLLKYTPQLRRAAHEDRCAFTRRAAPSSRFCAHPTRAELHP